MTVFVSGNVSAIEGSFNQQRGGEELGGSGFKKPRRSEVLYSGIVPYYFYDYSDDHVKKMVVLIDLSTMKTVDDFLNYLQENELYFQPLKSFDSVCIAGKCFSTTEAFKSSAEFIKNAIQNESAQFYLNVPLNDPEKFFFQDSLLYDTWSEDDQQRLLESVRKEIGWQESFSDSPLSSLDDDDDEDDWVPDETRIDYPSALSASYDESDEYQADAEESTGSNDDSDSDDYQ